MQNRKEKIVESNKLLEIAVKAADSKRAEDVMALDVKEISLLADYFLITHGNSERQVGAIVDAVKEEIEKNKGIVKRIEGKDGGKWILMDLGEVIVHVFNRDERSFYNLEKLWSDAPLVDISAWIEED